MVGDRITPISGKLVQSGAVVNLTGSTVLFHMVKKDGTVKVDEQAATVVSAVGGLVRYAPTANDVDTEGEFFAWFIVVDGSSLRDSFPHDGNKYLIHFHEVPSPT